MRLDAMVGDVGSGPLAPSNDGTFRGDGRYAAFKMIDGQHYLFTGIQGDHFAFRRLSWWQDARLHMALAGLSFLVLLGYPLVAAVTWLWRKMRKKTRPKMRQLLWVIGTYGAAIASAAFLGALMAILAGGEALVSGPVFSLYALFCAALGLILATIIMLIAMRRDFRWSSLVSVAAMVTLSALMIYYEVPWFDY